MKLQSLTLLFLSFILLACEQNQLNELPAEPAPDPVVQETRPEPPEQKAPVQAPLDLSLPETLELPDGNPPLLPEQPVLPGLEKREQESNVKLRGKLKLDPDKLDKENPEYLDSLEGGEISIEIKVP